MDVFNILVGDIKEQKGKGIVLRVKVAQTQLSGSMSLHRLIHTDI